MCHYNTEHEVAQFLAAMQGIVEGRIKELNAKIARSNVIYPSEIYTEKVVFGAKVTIIDIDTDAEVTYQIVGEDEAEIKDGKISITSPVGRSLIGHEVDEEVSITVPSGVRVYEITNIEYS
jgi:transcription elongation factor GreA